MRGTIKLEENWNAYLRKKIHVISIGEGRKVVCGMLEYI